MQTLNEITLDGVCQSNDTEYAFNGSGKRDGTILNLVIQGPAMVNNGYCAYDGGKPDDRHANTEEQALDATTKRPSKNPHMSRTIEKHARGSIEAQNHVFASGRVTVDVVNNTLSGAGVPKIGSPWLPNGVFDFIASFTGQYSSFPVQMFDRSPQCMNALYLGLVAYELTNAQKRELVDSTGAKVFDPATYTNDAAGDALLEREQCAFYQYVPFSSRQAWLRQQLYEMGRDPTIGSPAEAKKQMTARINRTSGRGSKKFPLDEDPFDAVRSHDLEHMVGAWKVGRVLDVKSMRHTAYEGGPASTGSALTVDVQIGWHDVRPQHVMAITDEYDDTGGGARTVRAYRNRFGGEELLSYNNEPTAEADPAGRPRYGDIPKDDFVKRRSSRANPNRPFPSASGPLGGPAPGPVGQSESGARSVGHQPAEPTIGIQTADPGARGARPPGTSRPTRTRSGRRCASSSAPGRARRSTISAL